MKKVGLFFGTFNPVHVGHVIIANHFVEFSDLEEVWFVITPQSPFKIKKLAVHNEDRYQMVYEAIQEYPNLKPNKIEFTLPQPNYTINTLVHLQERYGKQYQFSLILGEDNLKHFHKWKNYHTILEHYSLYIYPRICEGIVSPALQNHPKITTVDAPVIEISSSFIRKAHKAGKNIKPLLPEAVWNYIDKMNLYR